MTNLVRIILKAALIFVKSQKYCGDSGVLCRVYCHVTNFSPSCFEYWMSGNGTISHSSSVVVYLITHINFGSVKMAGFAISQFCERVRFGRDVN